MRKKLPQKRECPHCGKTYESVTTICPFCGKDSETPVEKPAPTPANPQNTIAPTPQAPTQTKQPKKSKCFWPIVIGGALIMTLVYGIAVFYGVTDFLGNKKSEEPSYSRDKVASSSSSDEYESSNSSSNTTNQMPSWIVGDWKCNTLYGTITMTINSDGSGLFLDERGTFTYNGDELEFRNPNVDGVVTPMEVDEANLRLGAGQGYYFTKVTNNNSSSEQSNNYDNSSSNNYATTQYLTLIGAIDNKYPITMDLEQNGSDLRGSYYYNRNGPDQRLNVYGQLDGSRFRLQEYDNDDNNTGNFVGTYHNGMVTGTFSLPDGKTMSFDLEVVN